MNFSTFSALLCSLFLIGCGGGGSSAEPLPPIVSQTQPVPPSLFNTDPIVLSDPQTYYTYICASPTLSKVIPIDINLDKFDDFIIHYWCGQDEFGNSVRGETKNIIVAFVSDGAGGYQVDNYNVFGESYPSLGGASRKYKIFDINGDGKDDIAWAMNNEDGRSAYSWEDQLSNGSQPTVLLSTETGFTIERMGQEDWGHAVSITSTGDVIFAGFNLGTQAFRYNGTDWLDVTSEYPNVSPAAHLINGNFIANAERRSEDFGFYITSKVDNVWTRLDEFMITKEFDVQWESWNNNGTGNYDPYPVTELYGKKYFGGMLDSMCKMNEKLVVKINSAELKDGTEPVEGQYYQETDTQPVNMFMFFKLVDNKIVQQNSIIDVEDIAVNFNDWTCNDINHDGKGDIVASAFSELWNMERYKGGKPIVYLSGPEASDHSGYGLVNTNTDDWPAYSTEKDTAGFMHDIDNNGTVDLIIHTLNTTNGADIEIYTTNIAL